MNLPAWFQIFKNEESFSPDDLGAYPERLQVAALPERKYIKTFRILAIITFICMGLLLALSGIYIYMARNVDMTLVGKSRSYFFSINPQAKTLRPVEYSSRRISAMQLVTESTLREYINMRNTIIWDADIMKWRWGARGPVAHFSDANIFKNFELEANSSYTESRANRFIRDVHLYDFHLEGSGLWTGVMDTFDLPITDTLLPICPCSGNSKECLQCKIENTTRHERRRVYIRTHTKGPQTPDNPLGIIVMSYHLLYMPIHHEATYWDIPPELRPEI